MGVAGGGNRRKFDYVGAGGFPMANLKLSIGFSRDIELGVDLTCKKNEIFCFNKTESKNTH